MCKFLILVYFIYLINNEVSGFSKRIVNNMIVNETRVELPTKEPTEIYFVPKNSTTNSNSNLITKLNFTKNLERNPHDLVVIGGNPNYFKYEITSNNGEKPKIPLKNSNEENYKKKLEYLNLLFNCSVLADTLKDKSVFKAKKNVPTTAIPIFNKIKNWEKSTKKPIKIVYESPTPIKILENTLSSMYNFFEDVFTTKVKIPIKKSKRQIKSKKKLRGNTINRRQGLSSTTIERNVHTTPSVKFYNKKTPKNNKQFKTTQSYVTSEYSGPTTPTLLVKPSTITIKKKDKSESSEESSEDDYDFNFSFDNEEDSSDISAYDDKKPSSYGHDDDEEYDDDDDEDYSDNESIFGRIFSSLSKFFGGNRKKKSSVYQFDEGRSTTPRIDYRKPKNPIYSENLENTLQKTWYNPYVPSSHYDLSTEEEVDESNEIITNAPTTQSGWFNNWFQNGDNKIDEIITTTTSTTTQDPGWFNGLFGNPFDYDEEVLTTTTAIPSIKLTDSYTNFTEWISFLTQKLKLKSPKHTNTGNFAIN